MARGARTTRRTGCRAGPAITGSCISPRRAPHRDRATWSPPSSPVARRTTCSPTGSRWPCARPAAVTPGSPAAPPRPRPARTAPVVAVPAGAVPAGAVPAGAVPASPVLVEVPSAAVPVLLAHARARPPRPEVLVARPASARIRRCWYLRGDGRPGLASRRIGFPCPGEATATRRIPDCRSATSAAVPGQHRRGASRPDRGRPWSRPDDGTTASSAAVQYRRFAPSNVATGLDRSKVAPVPTAGASLIRRFLLTESRSCARTAHPAASSSAAVHVEAAGCLRLGAALAALAPRVAPPRPGRCHSPQGHRRARSRRPGRGEV